MSVKFLIKRAAASMKRAAAPPSMSPEKALLMQGMLQGAPPEAPKENPVSALRGLPIESAAAASPLVITHSNTGV